ncbi:MAG TPA: ABC transporter permease [Mesorhizobium sp.]|uniref:ABC transporter permease n=1 Tax=Mesorhizobium sp. TaxID=1871066 RepID=UPI002DDD26D0|nr:ABC transporter permease [Mesorhizobium sp.]HEV2501671.1 ABC transporter permease [Mesorhizobium sp.]
MEFVDIILISASALRLAVPVLLAAMGGLYAESSGVVDIGLEGKMLFGAFAAGTCAALTGDAWLGLLGGVSVAITIASAQAFASITLRGNQIVIGLAVNILASGLTAFLGIAWFQRGGQTPSLDGAARFGSITFPFVEQISAVPVLGLIYRDVLSNQTVLTYFALAAVLITWVVLYRTRYGLRIRACGDKPEAVDSAGISVAGLRYSTMAINGALCGLAGAYLALVQGGAFFRDMTAGQGYMALAALIFGNWRPGRVFAACIVFAFADALQGRLQGTALASFEIPVQLIQAVPYLLTILLLAGIVGKAEGPAAAGKPYIKGER